MREITLGKTSLYKAGAEEQFDTEIGDCSELWIQ
jgi:hypothetical protein